jgi:NAD(P)-dependent dehydrogenase (short-subunit alcohol dehydrogenase family)
MERLRNKVAVITGASSGLGRAIAIRFAQEGAAVVLGDINEAGGAETLSLLPAGARAKFVRLDVTKEADCEAAVALAVTEYGGLDVMVANAGIGAPGFSARAHAAMAPAVSGTWCKTPRARPRASAMGSDRAAWCVRPRAALARTSTLSPSA